MFVQIARHILPFSTLHPSDVVIVALAAMGTSEIGFFYLLLFFKDISLLHQ